MGVKLRNIVVVNLLLLITSCSSKKAITYQSKEAFIQSFKTSVLYGCINGGTDSKFQKFSIENNDLGLAQEVSIIFHAETEQAILIGEELSKRIEPIEYSDYEGRKPIFSDCVNYAMYSKEIDSTAHAKYKKWKKTKLEYKTE